MKRLIELFSDDRGHGKRELSRTQVCLWIVFFFTLTVTAISVYLSIKHDKDVLTPEVLCVFLGLHAFAIFDRIKARHINLKIGKDGVDISANGNCTENHAENGG